MGYQTTPDFLRMFGYTGLNDLPELPRYKLDENKQIVIEEIIENNTTQEAPSPEREEEHSENDDENKEQE